MRTHYQGMYRNYSRKSCESVIIKKLDQAFESLNESLNKFESKNKTTTYNKDNK